MHRIAKIEWLFIVFLIQFTIVVAVEKSLAEFFPALARLHEPLPLHEEEEKSEVQHGVGIVPWSKFK